MDDLTSYTLDQIKTLYNTSLASARTEAEKARRYRDEIEQRESSYRGRSCGKLADAVMALFGARTFANTPNDLAESANPYRR